MRISERKRQLREQAGAIGPHAERTVPTQSLEPRARQPRRPIRGSAAPRGSARQVAPQRQIKQRGPRFYWTIGAIGVVFAAILAQSTYTSYTSAKDKYPGKLAQYQTALARYKADLVTYQAGLAHHAQHLVNPHAPTTPIHPTLEIGSFFLPILYLLLSVTYVYLGYRANKRQQGS